MAARPPRYTLRTLLVLVAISAAGAWIFSGLPDFITKAELAGVLPGMTQDEVRTLLGEPIDVMRSESGPNGEMEESWLFAVWGRGIDNPPTMYFRNGRVVRVRY